MPETERIAAALEPALREVIDMTMERVAKIEQETMREARELMVSAGQNSKEALDRSSRLVNSLDALTGRVTQVTSVLRTEVDEVTESLRGLHGLKVELPEEPSAGNASDAEPQHAEPQTRPGTRAAPDPSRNPRRRNPRPRHPRPSTGGPGARGSNARPGDRAQPRVDRHVPRADHEDARRRQVA